MTQLYRVFGNGQGGWYPAYENDATYDLAGHIKTQTYPSSRTVTYNYDGAGRNSSFTGNLGDNTQRTYSSGMQYSAFGDVTREQFGTDVALYHNIAYNVRGQAYYIGLGAVNDGWGGDYGKLIYYYGNAYGFGGSGPDNNGNISLIDYYLPNGSLIHDHYTYDSLNRLGETSEEDTGWRFKQKYEYDRYGNRTINTNPAYSWGPINLLPFSVDTATNRLTAPGQPSAMQYDASGNVTYDSYTGQGTRVYDAENRMKQAWANSQWQTYSYDGDGARIKRVVNQTETWQIYGIGGEMVAEYAPAASPSSPQKEYGYRNGELLIMAEASANIHYSVADHVGTPRMIVSQSGVLASVSRHDYLPFGEELFASVGVRTTGSGYPTGPNSNDNVRQRFTEKERDNETGLDFFEARYFSSTQGRFTSGDALLSSGIPGEPQSWNRYSYTINNPLKFTDPSGLIWVYQDRPGVRTFRWYDDEKDVPKGWTVFTGSYYDGADGRYYFNPNGPEGPIHRREDGLGFNYNWDPYVRNGWMKGPTPEQYAHYMASGAVEDETWDIIGLLLLRGPKGKAVEGALEGGLTAKATTEALEAIPKAANSRLQRTIEALFQSTERIPGGTAGAIRRELETGEATGGTFHSMKGQQTINRLRNIMREEKLSPADQVTAQRLMHDLQDALKGKN